MVNKDFHNCNAADKELSVGTTVSLLESSAVHGSTDT